MTEWQTDSQVVSKELELLCNMDGIDGAAIYDYASTFQPESSVSEILSSERDAIQVQTKSRQGNLPHLLPILVKKINYSATACFRASTRSHFSQATPKSSRPI